LVLILKDAVAGSVIELLRKRKNYMRGAKKKINSVSFERKNANAEGRRKNWAAA